MPGAAGKDYRPGQGGALRGVGNADGDAFPCNDRQRPRLPGYFFQSRAPFMIA